MQFGTANGDSFRANCSAITCTAITDRMHVDNHALESHGRRIVSPLLGASVVLHPITLDKCKNVAQTHVHTNAVRHHRVRARRRGHLPVRCRDFRFTFRAPTVRKCSQTNPMAVNALFHTIYRSGNLTRRTGYLRSVLFCMFAVRRTHQPSTHTYDDFLLSSTIRAAKSAYVPACVCVALCFYLKCRA